MSLPKQQIRAELYISSDKAKRYFALLEVQREAVERELGYSLSWEELPAGQDSRVVSYMNDVDPENRADWPRQHEWLAKRLNEMHRVFAPRVVVLDADADGRSEENERTSK